MTKDFKLRNKIIFGKEDAGPSLGGTYHFDDLSVDKLNDLVENDFIDLDDCQNLSPSAGDFFEFMKKYPEVKAHGYAVSPERSDCRVSLEGISYEGTYTKDMLLDFVDLCRLADEFTVEDDRLYAWWD